MKLQKSTETNNNHPRQPEPTSFSNENFTFSGSNLTEPKKTAVESSDLSGKESSDDAERLQSPVESHFAVTPVANSEGSSPANGFTSVDCNDLLQQELDELEQKESKQTPEKKDDVGVRFINTVSMDGLLSPTDENISMFSRMKVAEDKLGKSEIVGDGLDVGNSDSGEVGLGVVDFVSVGIYNNNISFFFGLF